MNTILRGWPYLGLGAALLLIVGLAIERRPTGAGPRWHDPVSVLPLLWPMYLLHQFEEHGIDLLGRHYAFLADMCASLGHAGDLARCPADEAFIFAVNVGGCQIVFATALVFRRRSPLVAACAWGLPLVNGVAHVAGSLRTGAYNPGLFTSLILFLPLGAWMLHVVVRSGAVRARQIGWVLAAGVATHAVLLGSLVLEDRGVLSRGAMLVANVLNGLWPIAFGTLGAARAARPLPRTATEP
jgi:hypothetical protein